MFNLTFSKIKNFLNKVIDVLIPIVTVMLLLGIVFGGPVLGLDVIGGVTDLVEMLASNGVVGLLVLAILYSLVAK